MATISVDLVTTLNELLSSDLKSFQWHLTSGMEGFERIPKAHLEKADRFDIVDKMVQSYGQDGALEITLAILKKLNQNQLAEELETKQSSNKRKKVNKAATLPAAFVQSGLNALTTGVNKCKNLKSPTSSPTTPDTPDGQQCEKVNDKSPEVSKTPPAVLLFDKRPHIHLMHSLMEMYDCVLTGKSQKGHQKYLDDLYVDPTIVVNDTGGAIQECQMIAKMLSNKHSRIAKSSVKFNKIFKAQSDKSRRNRRVLTIGMSGVGKTMSVSKFILDWAKGRENKEIKYIFPLRFSELNLKKDEEFSLIELLNHCFFCSQPALQKLPEDDGKILFIFDGLDECRFPLSFDNNNGPNNIDEKASVSALITSLIKRQILPLALIWITCRPTAAHQIPQKYFELVTEVRGFSDEQKEAYLSKYCAGDVGMKVFSYIKKSKNLQIKCQTPVFCWITATALQPMMVDDNDKEMPSTLTGMYINFLLQQKNLMENQCKEEPPKQADAESIILKFGKLALRNLESGTNTYCEEDLMKCGIDISDGTVFSTDCLEIFCQHEEVSGRKLFSFTHQSVRESLAALYVHYTQCQNRRNALKRNSIVGKVSWLHKSLKDLHIYAVKKSLQCENGQLDHFLCFLLGLSLESNQNDLMKLLPSLKVQVKNVNDTVKFLKKKLTEQASSERSLNLLHCLSELNDYSLTSEIQNYLNSGNLSKHKLTPTQWSALVLVLLMSEEIQEKFELRKYIPSDEGLRRLLPVLKNTQRALLSDCNLTENSSETLCSALTSATMRELDLSNNSLQDSGAKQLSVGLKSSHCKLEILRLSRCFITQEGCCSLASALSSDMKELDLSDNNLEDSAMKRLIARLEDPHSKLETLRLANCNLLEETCKNMGTVLNLAKSPLRELDLSKNNLQDSGVKLLSAGLKNSHCKLEILRLHGCLVTEEGCCSLASALSSNPLNLKLLDLTYNNPGDSGLKQLTAILADSHCMLETLKLASCNLGEETCKNLASVLQLEKSTLRELDLSDNDLQDSGVRELCTGLKSTDCKLEILRLSGCLVTEEGCCFLASALSLNSLNLKELDLSYNNPGDSGVKLFSAILEDQRCKLDTLILEHTGTLRIKPGLRKYACDLTLDPNTAHRLLSLPKGTRKVMCVQEPQSYPKHPDRFDCCVQVLCREGLSGRCYWETEWTGEGAEILVAYKGISRKGRSYECESGWNLKSWKLICTETKFSAFYNKIETVIETVPGSSSKRVAVYLDWPAGTLFFYSVSSDTHALTPIHTFHCRFTEPLYAGFGFGLFGHGSSVNICELE